MPSEMKSRRKALGLTQVEFAGEIGVNPITVSRWETGARNISEVRALWLDTKLRELERRQRRRAPRAATGGSES